MHHSQVRGLVHVREVRVINTAWTTSMQISYVTYHIFLIHWWMNERMNAWMNEWMNEWEYDHFVLYVALLYRQVLLVDNSLMLNHIITRRSTVLQNETFGTQRYTIVNHNSNESYEMNYHNSVYNNHCNSNNIFFIIHSFSTIHDWNAWTYYHRNYCNNKP